MQSNLEWIFAGNCKAVLYSVLRVFPQELGPVAQLVRAPPCHGGGRGFESLLGRFKFGIIAQLGEHLPYKQGVTGSSPVGPIFIIKVSLYAHMAQFMTIKE